MSIKKTISAIDRYVDANNRLLNCDYFGATVLDLIDDEFFETSTVKFKEAAVSALAAMAHPLTGPTFREMLGDDAFTQFVGFTRNAVSFMDDLARPQNKAVIYRAYLQRRIKRGESPCPSMPKADLYNRETAKIEALVHRQSLIKSLKVVKG